MGILPQLLVNSLILGSLYALVSSGLSLTYGLLRVLNFAHGQFVMLGSYLFYFFLVGHSEGFGPSLVLSLALMLIISAFSLRVFLLPFLEQNELLPLVTSMALAIMLESLVSIYFGVDVKALPAGQMEQSIERYGIYITPLQISIILITLFMVSLVAALIHGTAFGRKLRALSENKFAALGLGADVNQIYYVVFGISIVLASIGGILIAFETNLQPSMGTILTVKAFAIMILGGLGNIWGTIISAYILSLLENLSIGLEINGSYLPASYKDAVAYIIILLVLLFRPRGLFGAATRKS